jgi:hypothetical protein
MRQLGGLGFQELAPRRRAEEQLAHLDAGALAAGGRLQLAAAGVQPTGLGRIDRAADDGGFGHRGDGGQRLAAEAHGGHAFELGQRADLAGGVALEGQRQLLGRDAAAVVLDHDGPDAAGHQPHGDLVGARIQRVVHQLAHHRGRALHHLAGGDLADQFVGQFSDGAAGASSVPFAGEFIPGL